MHGSGDGGSGAGGPARGAAGRRDAARGGADGGNGAGGPACGAAGRGHAARGGARAQVFARGAAAHDVPDALGLPRHRPLRRRLRASSAATLVRAPPVAPRARELSRAQRHRGLVGHAADPRRVQPRRDGPPRRRHLPARLATLLPCRQQLRACLRRRRAAALALPRPMGQPAARLSLLARVRRRLLRFGPARPHRRQRRRALVQHAPRPHARPRA
mmetsp:Transcript_18476/g.39769  ORF Transcript_18476/g.39769 Transcript_18476/m.39769 type:complete len:216 (+) Transcript_18476:525-1172(+)